MGRPSKKAERAAEILDTYETCIAKYGIEGTTLERLANEAGMARALIRHHAGNRDDLIKAATDRFVERSTSYMQSMRDYLPQNGRVRAMLDLLFDEQYSDPHFVQVANALAAAAPIYPELNDRMVVWMGEFIELIGEELKQEYSGQSEQALKDVATGITGIYFNTDSMAILKGIPENFRASSHAACLRLVDSLNP